MKLTPILFEDNATDYVTQGIGALGDVLSGEVTEETNGQYEVRLTYPVTGRRYADLKNRRLIYCKPDPYRDAQPFRVYRITRPLNGIITIYARHKLYDLDGTPVNPFSASNALSAMKGLKANAAIETPYQFWTDINSNAQFSVSVPTSTRALLGGIKGSILDTYGGEYEWDNDTVKLYARRGSDNGVTISYGKNLTDIEQDENIANLCTGIIGYWANSDGELVQTPVVNGPGTYNFANVKAVDFSLDFESKPTVEQLQKRAQQYVSDNNVGIPDVSITLSWVQLEQYSGYEGLSLLDRVSLGDTVTVRFPPLGIDVKARVVKTVYDILQDRYSSVEIGSVKANIADTIANNQQATNEQIKNTTSYLEDRIQQSTDLITNGGGYIYRKFDAAKNWVEIGSTDNLDLNKAVHVWRWNNGGFGHSGDGYNGPYRTAITQDGHIVADFIDAGTLTANIMRAGILQDVEGKAFYLDLPNGVLRMNATELFIKSSAVATKDYADDAANQARDEAIQSAVDQAEAAFGQELQLYPTKVEMDSAIRQSAGEISSQVNMTLEGYATKDYTDTAEQDAKDFASSAAQDALDQANADTDGKLALYPTTVEMNSAITQTASQITSQVSQTLTQYSTTSESQAYADGVAGDAETAAKQYADQAAGQAEDAANAATDGKLKNYSTTVQMNSAINQKADQITLSVKQTLTRYATTEESEQYADQAAGQAEDAANAATDGKLKNYSTTIQMNSAIEQSASEILSTVSNTYTTEVQAASAGRNLVSNTAFIGYDPQDSAATVQDGVLTIKPVNSQKRLEFPLDFTPYGLGEIKKISTQNHVTISGEYRIDKKINYNGSVSSPNYVVLEITTESGAPVELKAPATPIPANVTSGWVSFSEWYNPSLGNIVSARLVVVCDRAYRGSISWRNLKVEMGKTATPWSAAPEDVVLQIGYSKELSQQVSDAFDEKLTFYPTSVEMNSAIKQSADSIQLTVDKTLTGYVTKDDITLYPTTVEMNSAIKQSANQIELSVEQTLTGYSTTSQMQAAIDLAVSGINLSVSNGSESSTLTLKHGSTTLASAQITFSGLVNFVTQSDLSTAGQTTINGGNIKTGTIDSTSGYTHLDLAAGDFRVGVSTTDRVEITPEGIVWYAGDNVYGQLAHGRIRVDDTRMWITSDSRYQMLGWLHEDTGDYQCLEVEETDNAVSVPNRLNVGGVCSVRTLTAWDGKDRVVQTDHWGNRAIAAMESPEPMFFDAGSAEIDADGLCYIEINPIYEETASATVERRWYVTPTSDGALWVDKQPWGAVVHGAPGMTFDWMVGSIQRGYEGIYAEVNTDNYPNVHYKPGDGLNDAVLRSVFDPMADAVTDYLDETDYNAILREAFSA